MYFTAVLEYLCAELVELAGQVAREHRRQLITPRHIMLAIRNDTEINKLLAHITIANGGVVPGINAALATKRRGSKTTGKKKKKKKNKATSSQKPIPAAADPPAPGPTVEAPESSVEARQGDSAGDDDDDDDVTEVPPAPKTDE